MHYPSCLLNLNKRPFKFVSTALATVALLCLPYAMAWAQAPVKPNAAQIKQQLEGMDVLGSALYFAAHPDDENTRMIAYLAKGMNIRTAYLSLTRGDGGQNLIGPELRDKLGIIRTQELLAARRKDGGSQFFSRANDFGYSKHPNETFTIWNRQQVLADAVWVIRKFRPDIIVLRFSMEPGRTHGHHTASSMIAAEAFEAAADPTRFPEQLEHVQVWQPKHLYWNTSWWFYGDRDNFDDSGLQKVDVGAYSPILGQSYAEIAAISRSQHKSQGFGSSGRRGTNEEYLEHLKGTKPQGNNIFEGIDISWARVPNAAPVQAALTKANQNFNPQAPQAILPYLLQARKALSGLPQDNHWVKVKTHDLDKLIQACTGLFVGANASTDYVVPGQELTINLEALVQLPVQQVQLLDCAIVGQGQVLSQWQANQAFQENQPLTQALTFTLPANTPVSQPYWLSQNGTKGMFEVPEQTLIGLPENPPALEARFTLAHNGQSLQYTIPVQYTYTDPVKGEVYKPLFVGHALTLKANKDILLFTNQTPQKITLTLTAWQDSQAGQVAPQLPKGWKSQPASQSFSIDKAGTEQQVSFTITPPNKADKQRIGFTATVGNQSYSSSLTEINYDHIPAQRLYEAAALTAVRIDLLKGGTQIGYIMGAGDVIPDFLRQVGYEVTLLEQADMRPERLKEFNTIMAGVRAYNTKPWLYNAHTALMQYVQQGGVYLVQYNTNRRVNTDRIGPYGFNLSRDRVTVEEAPVRIMAPNHPALNRPNKITAVDFQNWVQERGLYFPNQWANEYTPLLSSNDPGEPERNGGLLVAPYGQGWFVYTGYSWFRQLPAGVPGAYRILVNLMALGQ